MRPYSEDIARVSLSTRRILCVDGDETLRWLLSTFLRMLGASPVEVGSAEEALAYLDEHPSGMERPHLMVVDVDLPGMDGIALCERMSEDGHFPLDHVIVVSGTGSRDDRRRIAALGVRRFLPKPFLLEDFQDALSVPL
jgi:two-component system, OmpR family, response regulator